MTRADAILLIYTLEDALDHYSVCLNCYHRNSEQAKDAKKEYKDAKEQIISQMVKEE